MFSQKVNHMSTKTDYFLKTLHVLSWIIFIGVCIEAGGFIFSTFFTLYLNPNGATKFWHIVNLSDLYNYNKNYFIALTSQMIIVAVLRALLFYIIIKIFYEKKLTVSQPFNETIRRFIFNVAYLSLAIGLFSFLGAELAENIAAKGINIPDLKYLRIAGADVWLFMGITLLVIAILFKKGIEIQNEIDLTV